MRKQEFERFHSDEWIATEEEMLKEQGYINSLARCEGCGHPAMVKNTRKPFNWESDVMIYTADYRCPNCESHWQEVDSD